MARLAQEPFSPVGPAVTQAIADYCAEQATPRRMEPLLAWWAITHLEVGPSGSGNVRPCQAAARMGRHRTTEWRRRGWAQEAGLCRCSAPAPPVRRWGPSAHIAVELAYVRTPEVVRLARQKPPRPPRHRPGPPLGQRPAAEPSELVRRAEVERVRLERLAIERAQGVQEFAPDLAAIIARVMPAARAHAPPPQVERPAED